MADLYAGEIERFRELLTENRQYAFDRYGWTMFYSLDPEEIHETKAELGWKPSSALDHYNTGAVLCRSGKIAQGLKHLERAQELGLDIPQLYYNLALAYEKRDDVRKAKSLFRKFVDVVEQQDPIPASLRQDLDQVRAHLQTM